MFSVCLSIVGFFSTENIVKIFVAEYDDYSVYLLIMLTKITFFSIPFLSIAALSGSYLQVNEDYIPSIFLNIPNNIIVCISIVLSVKYGLIWLGYGMLFGSLAQLVVVIPRMKKKGFNISRSLNLNKNIFQMYKMVAPLFLSVILMQVNLLVDRSLASKISIGGIASLTYSNRLIELVMGIFVFSISTMFYPKIAKAISENINEKVYEMLNNYLLVVLFFLLPSFLGLIFFSNEIITMLYGRGSFSLAGIKLTSSALFFYAFGIFGMGIKEILTKTFYSMQDMKTPSVIATAGIILNIVLNILLSRFLGISGLALATSISANISMIIMYFSLRRRIGNFISKPFLVEFIKILFSSIIMIFISKVLNSFFISLGILNGNLSTLLTVCIASLIYLLLTLLFRVYFIISLFYDIKQKIKKVVLL